MKSIEKKDKEQGKGRKKHIKNIKVFAPITQKHELNNEIKEPAPKEPILGEEE